MTENARAKATVAEIMKRLNLPTYRLTIGDRSGELPEIIIHTVLDWGEDDRWQSMVDAALQAGIVVRQSPGAAERRIEALAAVGAEIQPPDPETLGCIVLVFKGRIHPYVRTTQRQRWVDTAYLHYRDSQNSIRRSATAQMESCHYSAFPHGVPLVMACSIQVAARLHTCDVSNQYKALEDALQGVAYGNDCWIDGAIIERHIGPADVAVVLIAPQGAYQPAQLLEMLDEAIWYPHGK